jgi:hypothetical protein
MINKDIIGGVTPLKKRSQKFKAGDVGKKATRKNVKLKTGFQRSGMESEGGRNYESLTGGMRVTSSLADSLKFKEPGKKTSTSGFDDTSTFEDTDIESGKERRTIEDKVVTEPEKKYEKKDQVCSQEYYDHSIATGRKPVGGPGSPECKEYNDFRAKNPKKRGTKKRTIKGYDECREWTMKDGKKVWTEWVRC